MYDDPREREAPPTVTSALMRSETVDRDHTAPVGAEPTAASFWEKPAWSESGVFDVRYKSHIDVTETSFSPPPAESIVINSSF